MAFSNSWGGRNFKESIRGTVVEVVIGEMDPFHVGDACIVYVKTTSKIKVGGEETYRGTLFGITEVGDDCYKSQEQLNALEGRTVYIPRANVNYLSDSKTIGVLKDYNSKAFYLDTASGKTLLESILLPK